MSMTITFDAPRLRRRAARGTDPLRTARPQTNRVAETFDRPQEFSPSFAPLLEELEIAGWSSQWRILSGHFHDWMLLDRGRVLVTVGQVAAAELADPMDTALMAQAASIAIRAHAHHCDDAGQLLTLAARTLRTISATSHEASLAVALVDAAGGTTSLAVAGECLVWRVRAAKVEVLASDQPTIGTDGNFTYDAQDFALSLRERLLLVADHARHRAPKFAGTIVSKFRHADAESHRRMTAADAAAIVREQYETDIELNPLASASVVAVRRR
jgi:hypothetical protein